MKTKIERLNEMVAEIRAMFPTCDRVYLNCGNPELDFHSLTSREQALEIFNDLGVEAESEVTLNRSTDCTPFTAMGGFSNGLFVKAFIDLPQTQEAIQG